MARASKLSRKFFLQIVEEIYIRRKNTDIDVVDKNYISVTPLQIDQTDFTFIKKLNYKVIIPSKKQQ
ncbi:hypothetical protein ATZ36_09565 [Candidatus Endomicrobiellum trichonymphae]|jgi:broad specificity polyphosphatase/5'/3'-nucleotidase SurE|uniref:5'-nucleotidase n=1 Tax=Endomicrobium trichonymphae TaxID=1408204 RepID=A0A1E5IGA6_ENDTX|nr:hypothetical protein ATZ36_09575 [Candidatus Endomicrobium trichonymphae]OEG69444.1 hypothetical protein ATZ36_09565 [Candidatus Endomicrobium trichonymphae]